MNVTFRFSTQRMAAFVVTCITFFAFFHGLAWGVESFMGGHVYWKNTSPSSPLGYYVWAGYRPISVGDWVIIDARSAGIPDVTADRLIKRVVARDRGAYVMDGTTVFLDDTVVANRLQLDHPGLFRSVMQGTLAPGELFLLNDPPDSYDSRYYGAVSAEHATRVALVYRR